MKTTTHVRKLIFPGILLGTLIVLLAFVNKKERAPFELRQRASSPTGTATITLLPLTHQYYNGDEFSVDVMLNTAGTAISGSAFRLYYPYTNSVTPLDVIDEDPNQSGIQIASFASDISDSLATQVNLVSKDATANGNVYIDFSVITATAEGFTNNQEQKLATIRFKAKQTGSFTLSHDPQRSQITRKLDGVDILQTITPATFTISQDTRPPTALITSGLEQDSVSTQSAVTFAWTGTDLPTRAQNDSAPLTYSYRFDANTWSAWGTLQTVTASLSNGAHTFSVRAKDASGNISTPAAPTSIRTFTLNLKPHITSIDPSHGPITTAISIYGYNFGASQGSVKFGTLVAPIVSWSDQLIVARVPGSVTSGNITVTRGTLVSTVYSFTLETMTRLNFNLQGITQDRGPQKVTIVIKQGTSFEQRFENVDATWNANTTSYSAYIGPMTEPFTTAANYSISIFNESRLRKRFTANTLTRYKLNIITKTAAADVIKVADFNNDNKLSIEDFGIMMSKLTSLSIPFNEANRSQYILFDLNRDDALDISDIGLLLVNYTQLETSGDPE